MIISTKRGTPAAELDKIIRELEGKGLSVTMIRGTDYNVFGWVGDTTILDERGSAPRAFWTWPPRAGPRACPSSAS